TIGFATKADMDADLAHDAGTLALVTNDDVDSAANNGTYRKIGGIGTGSWAKSADRVTALEGEVAGIKGKWGNVAGKLNGWPDPFFRTFDLTSQEFFGRDRWYT